MLSFYEPHEPKLLIQIHLDLMLSDQKKFEQGKKMLVSLVNHFPDNLCFDLIKSILEHKKRQYPNQDINRFKLKESEIFKIIMEKEIPEDKTKKIEPTLLEIFNQNPNNLKNDARDKLKKSDILTELKELSKNISKEDFLEFTDSAMKSAYDSNRVKALEFMLSFYNPNKPKLLIKIHLQRMLDNQKDFNSGKKMLIPLAKHFSYEFCDEIMNQYISFNKSKKKECEERKSEISKIILEQTLNKNNINKVKRIKL